MKNRKTASRFNRVIALCAAMVLLLSLTGCQRKPKRVTKENEEITFGIDVAKYQGTIDWDAVRHGGISGAVPFVWHRMPGFGDTNWRDIISILRSNGYEDDICIEGYHDPVYRGELEMTGQLHALNYLKWCIGGEFTPTPWEK